jgi:hypothetical protein
VPALDHEVVRVPPVVAKPSPTAAVFVWNPLSATGAALLFTAIVAALYVRLRPAEVGGILLGTLNRVKTSLLTIAAMLAIAYTTRFAGLDASMGLAFASTGALFAFFSPLLGWLGVALTGSDTSSSNGTCARSTQSSASAHADNSTRHWPAPGVRLHRPSRPQPALTLLAPDLGEDLRRSRARPLRRPGSLRGLETRSGSP